jgi:excisionase family DNA binding protein
MDRRYYTPREVSDLLRVSPTTVMKMIHEQRLYAVHVSERIYRIPVSAVRRLQEGGVQTYRPAEEWVESLPALGEPVDAEAGRPVRA